MEKKYFFISFNARDEKGSVGGGQLVVVCSCCLSKIYEALLGYYNKRVICKADFITFTSLTALDKNTAAKLSDNFTDGALIIEDGDNTEEQKQEGVEFWLARDSDGTLFMYFGDNPPIKAKDFWDCDDNDSFKEIDSSLFQQVEWEDKEPTKVKLVIDK